MVSEPVSHLGYLPIAFQDTLLVPQAGICACTSRGDCPPMGNLPSYRRCIESRQCPRICVRFYYELCFGRNDGPQSSRRSRIYKRGYVFRRGPLIIQMFQQEQVEFMIRVVSHPSLA